MKNKINTKTKLKTAGKIHKGKNTQIISTHQKKKKNSNFPTIVSESLLFIIDFLIEIFFLFFETFLKLSNIKLLDMRGQNISTFIRNIDRRDNIH
jgi:hypothetical protein